MVHAGLAVGDVYALLLPKVCATPKYMPQNKEEEYQDCFDCAPPPPPPQALPLGLVEHSVPQGKPTIQKHGGGVTCNTSHMR